jgi:hypothetical protein
MPVTNFAHPDPYKYQTGFGSYHECVFTYLKYSTGTN